MSYYYNFSENVEVCDHLTFCCACCGECPRAQWGHRQYRKQRKLSMNYVFFLFLPSFYHKVLKHKYQLEHPDPCTQIVIRKYFFQEIAPVKKEERLLLEVP